MKLKAPKGTARYALILAGLGLFSTGEGVEASPLAGQTLPAIQLLNRKGETRPAWQPGRVTVISFCAFWCDTWKEQSRRLDASRRALRGLPVDWTMISVDGRWSDKSQEGNWSDIAQDALLDTGSHWTHRLDVISVPYTLVVNGEGRILFATQGIARESQLRPAICASLSATPAQSSTLYLAFDDFPSRDPKLDDRLLDVLRAHDIKATFCGSEARRQSSPALVERARREGHTLSTAFDYTHKNLIDPFDFKAVGQTELLRRITGALAPGKTLVLHAGVGDTVQAFPFLLDLMQARNFKISPF